MAIYLDLDKIRREITINRLLDFYSIRLKQIEPNHLSGCCPIHQGDNPNAFHVDLEKNLFNCFTHCGGGSIFDFVMKKEKLSFYNAASKIWNIFYSPSQRQSIKQENAKVKVKQELTLMNLRLKLQHQHCYLEKRNIPPQLARYFQMGFCQYGMMKNRIAIPVFDIQNRIVAYCGRAVQQDVYPKYLFPKKFNKSGHLFNIQHITPHTPHTPHTPQPSQYQKPVFIVEGFFDCIHIVKLGFDAVALMGSSISQQQLTLLKEINRFYILMLDGDEAGEKATIKVSNKMAQFKLTFKTVYLIEVKEPELLDYDFLEMTTRN
ncbi:MAG: CHC2 zinc finger domain-containing protein [candidate division WOR-3 bacterium]